LLNKQTREWLYPGVSKSIDHQDFATILTLSLFGFRGTNLASVNTVPQQTDSPVETGSG
jgi:hypothetical protein